MPSQSLWSKDNKSFTLFGQNIAMAQKPKRPMVLLFDVGGVCVVSPFQAILDYEKSKGIPPGWVNWSISQTKPNGSWHQLERGELPLDRTFFNAFKADLTDEKRWRAYYAKYLTEKHGQNASEAASQVPPVPDIDAEWLHNQMMLISREMDPHMGPALKKLRQAADRSGGTLILGALSNTCIFPPTHFLYERKLADGRASKRLDGIFDVFISSAHVGMRKPDEDIYRYTITRLHEYVKTKEFGDGVRAEDITFFDDIGENLRTAKKLGMKTVKVNLGRVDLAVAELEKITGLELTGERSRL